MENGDGDSHSMRVMSTKIDKLLLRYAGLGVLGLFLLAAMPLIYQGYLLVAPASTWLKINDLYVYTDPRDSVQKVMLGREIPTPPLTLRSIWKVRDADSDQPLCYREISALWDKSEQVASPIDQFMRTCDRRRWIGKRLLLSANIKFGLQYGIEKEIMIVARPFEYNGDGLAATN